MNYLSVLAEYEQILLGNRSDFSQIYMSRLKNGNDLRKVLRYITERILHWTPQQTKIYLTPEIVNRMKLRRLIQQIEFPPELDPEKDLFYVACFMYPDQISFQKRKRVQLVYEKLLRGEINKFPKNFFLFGFAEYNIQVCIMYAINHYTAFHSLEELYAFFADRKEFIPFAKKVHLLEPIQSLYECPVDLLHDALSPETRDDFLYKYNKYKYFMKYGENA